MKSSFFGLRWLCITMLCMTVFSVYAQKTLTIHANRVARTFQVTLPANATTGYQWSVKHYDKSLFQFKSQQYIRPTSRLMGAGGHATFTFQLRRGQPSPKQTDILFSYARPWEPSKGTLTKVTVIFE